MFRLGHLIAVAFFSSIGLSAHAQDAPWWQDAFVPEGTATCAGADNYAAFEGKTALFHEVTCKITGTVPIRGMDGVILDLKCEEHGGVEGVTFERRQLLLKVEEGVISYPPGDKMVRCPIIKTLAEGPSFSCSGRLSDAEQIICQDEELAALDRKLAAYYKTVEGLAAKTMWGIERETPASTWFKSQTAKEWQWREKNCHDRDCLMSWYWRRTALLKWLATAEHGLGDTEPSEVRQLAGRDVVVSYHMGLMRNVLYGVTSDAYETLPDGDIKVISESPFIYEAQWQKGYLKQGGAFWFNTLRDAQHRILVVSPAEEDSKECWTKQEFFALANLDADRFALVSADQICVTR